MIKAYDLLNRYKKLSKEECAANFRINGHTTKIMKQTNTKKLAVAAVFCAVAVAGSLFSFPVFGSKCSPVQHMVNILCAVLLGPGYGLGAAFAAALIRNLLGLGSLMAFPGSMIGALCCGLAYMAFRKLWLTCIAEASGTGILGGLAAYPVAKLFMGLNPGGLFVYIVPFLVSTVVGSILAYFLVGALQKGGVISQIRPERTSVLKKS